MWDDIVRERRLRMEKRTKELELVQEQSPPLQAPSGAQVIEGHENDESSFVPISASA